MMKSLIFAVSLFASLIAAQDSCSLCPGGSQNYTADKPIYVFDAFEFELNVTTCGELAGLALVDNSSDTCEFIQSHAAWCECAGVTPTCTFCPNGTAPVDGNIMVPFHNITCDAYDYGVSVESSASDSSASDCIDHQAFASFCGCPGVTSNETCSLCPNGETAPNPGAVHAVLGTCANIETLTTAITPGDLCIKSQVAGLITCGCSPSNETSTGNCTVCADGSSFPNPDKAVVVTDSSPPVTITCGTFAWFASLLVDEDECAVVSNLVADACDCTPAAPSPITCPLCEDGGIPPRFLDNVDSTFTCYELASMFAFEDASSLNCTAMQATGVYCGCNNTKASQAATCRVCGGDMLLPDTAVQVEEGNMAGTPCGQIEYYANAGDILCSEAQSYASACCDSTVTDAPASTSSPAPAGSSPTVSPASGPPGAQPTSQPVDQPTPSTSGAMVSAVMVSIFLPMISIGFGLL